MTTMSNMAPMPQDVFVKRSDPVYMAHSYLTKVPLAAIEPFIRTFSQPGDMVVDPFAGSGMTGVAAAILGRRARLFDISVLGRHIGTNYLNIVEPGGLRTTAHTVVRAAIARAGNLYAVSCARCGDEHAVLAKRTWSIVVECPSCGAGVNFYRRLESASWHKSKMVCPSCSSPISSKAHRISEEPVVDSIACSCSPTQLAQPPTGDPATVPLGELDWKDVAIPADRQMYQASALGKHGLTTVASFYSPRNLAMLAALRAAITAIGAQSTRDKLMFAFTAILTRASKRYQWSRERPLNAANANYYVAAVFYEWNVLDLFERKIEAVLRSDDWILQQHGREFPLSDFTPDVTYETTSAESLPLPDSSVDYVFTDPPFGSNLFYADMALFQEAWLSAFTDHNLEAVIDRGTRKKRDGDRYQRILVAALAECRRVLRPGKFITMVFGNSTGAVWALVQRAIAEAGLVIEPGSVAILNKGQRSVKGLASGFEHVATVDLILSMRERREGDPSNGHTPSAAEIEGAVAATLADGRADSPSHLYLELLRRGIAEGWDLAGIDLSLVTQAVTKQGWLIDPATGRLGAGDSIALRGAPQTGDRRVTPSLAALELPLQEALPLASVPAR